MDLKVIEFKLQIITSLLDISALAPSEQPGHFMKGHSEVVVQRHLLWSSCFFFFNVTKKEQGTNTIAAECHDTELYKL